MSGYSGPLPVHGSCHNRTEAFLETSFDKRQGGDLSSLIEWAACRPRLPVPSLPPDRSFPLRKSSPLSLISCLIWGIRRACFSSTFEHSSTVRGRGQGTLSRAHASLFNTLSLSNLCNLHLLIQPRLSQITRHWLFQGWLEVNMKQRQLMLKTQRHLL